MSPDVHLEPQALAFAAANAHPPFLFNLGPVKGRQVLDQVQSGATVKPAVDIEDTIVPGAASDGVSVRIVRPQGAPATLPVVVYVHGAGWVFGDALTHDRLIRQIAVGAEAAVVFPNYSRSPEKKYPTALEEIYAVASWVARDGYAHGLDGGRMAIAGDSVGGNMATAVTMMAKERIGPAIVYQVLFYPVTDAAFDTRSYGEFAEGYHLRRDGMQWFWDQYTTDLSERDEPTASPLRATDEQLSGLPPALVITAEADVLRDEGEAYANRLRDVGVPVTAVRFQGIIHDFVMLDPLADTNAARGAIALATTKLRHALSGAR
jgi:acetyl esterase/lipase